MPDIGTENGSPMPEIEEKPATVPEVKDDAPPAPDDTPAVSFARRTYLLVKANGLNVRTGAGTGFSSLGKVNAGELLAYVGEKDGWRETLFRGRTAYVSAGYTSLLTLGGGEERTERVIQEGVRLLGVPYVYGATRFHDGHGVLLKGFSEDKFDCSSLMQYIFYRGSGVLLDVTTRTQIRQGIPVRKDELKRGDLMFFTNASRKDRTGVERVGHVALYLGDNYILHTASDFSKIEQLSPLRWSYFLEGRRVQTE